MTELDKLIKIRDKAERGMAKAKTPHEWEKHRCAYGRALRKMEALEEKNDKNK